MEKRRHVHRVAVLLCALLTACGGGSDVPATPVVPAQDPQQVQAARLLAQASFGPNIQDIRHATGLTPAAWIDEQIALAPTHHLPSCRALMTDGKVNQNSRLDAWWTTTLTAPDQLRQRLAFALSEIFVVSDVGNIKSQEGLCWYYDLLVDNAFGNFRSLLEQVTLSPEMGRYLSMLRNDKPDPANGRHADENFAREVMQLFTVGIVRLNADGSQQLDAGGNPLPTYSQADIENLARTFTGWSWNGSPGFNGGAADWLAPMQGFDSHHDTDAKTVIGNVVIDAGGSAAGDLQRGLDALFFNPTVGPFFGRQLIQKLVTSNPSPAYVARVSAVFADNGKGQRGDLQAVIKAVLLDPEARSGTAADFGKIREPLLQLSHLWRALDAKPATASGRYHYGGAEKELGQAPLSSPSVFNFFSPRYAPSGEVRDAALVLPEFQLANESSVAQLQNRLFLAIHADYVGNRGADPDAILIDYSALMPLAADPQKLLDRLDLLFMSGQMPAAMHSLLLAHLQSIPDIGDDGLSARIQEGVFLILSSPQYLIQR